MGKMNKISNIKNQNILFLQGPMGNFFKDIALSFEKQGATTYKIGFNMGDWFFSKKENYIPYKGKSEKWEEYIASFLKDKKIDKIFLFGDCRFYQRITIQVADKLGIEVFVFEEGYIRPHYITMEKHGVNDFSKISREPNFYLDNYNAEETLEVLDTMPSVYKRIWVTTVYFMMKDIFWFRYPHYRHHTEYNFLQEFFFGIRNLFRRYTYKITEKSIEKTILTQEKDNYYFVPLQTYNDFQVTEHSDFNSMEAFISVVIESFAKFAPKETKLVIKHHPMDRGRKNYTSHIKKIAKKHSVEDRVISVHDIYLPSCLKYAKGTVTINSTVGLSSLYHRTATIVLGRAIYDIEGLTCKPMSLDAFWSNATKPDKELYEAFRHYLVKHTQLNGSFYGRFPDILKNVKGNI